MTNCEGQGTRDKGQERLSIAVEGGYMIDRLPGLEEYMVSRDGAVLGIVRKGADRGFGDVLFRVLRWIEQAGPGASAPGPDAGGRAA